MSTILFLCPHSAAKSVLAAAYFDGYAQEHGLTWAADFAGTEPDARVSPAVVEMLRNEGIDVSGYQPRRVTPEDLTGARLIVLLGCSLEGFDVPLERLITWDDIPAPSANLSGARDAIRSRVETFVNQLRTQD